MFLHWKFVGLDKQRQPRFAVAVAASKRQPGEVWPKRRNIAYLATVVPTYLALPGARIRFWDRVTASLDLAGLDGKLSDEQVVAITAQLAAYAPVWTRDDYLAAQRGDGPPMPPVGPPPKTIATYFARQRQPQPQPQQGVRS